ncbi:MAG TPA: pyridoxamine 5'-phosphate oxidase family protein [Candidatus Eisenbacteria bacterium]|nr:pyridoxamine 5'-phosphate oxidase family protein [Candidatus Eisenbacteria bacterium]
MGEQEGSWTTTVHQHPERAVPQRAQEFLAIGHVAHIGFVQDGLPYVIPTLYHYSTLQPDRIYLHGGMSSRMLAELAKGIPVCVTVTELDGLVYSRGAKYHSANYRCVICFGRGRIFEDQQAKRVMFEAMTQRYFRGRAAGRDYTAAPSSHLATTAVVEVTIEQISAKMREGGPKGPHDADPNAPGTCGVVDV